jgi:nitroreductase
MTTRSMRRFSDEPVTDEEIEQILAAAVQAPSGGNIQPYQFVVVTDETRRGAIGEIYKRAYYRYEPAVLKLIPPFPDEDAQRRHERNWTVSRHLAETIGSAPAMVLVVMPRISMTVSDEDGDMDVGPTYASVYPAVQNLVLAARALGIGTVLTTVFRIHEDEVRAVCGIPDRYEIAALLPLGRPTGNWGVAPRRPAPSITNWNEWGNRR